MSTGPLSQLGKLLAGPASAVGSLASGAVRDGLRGVQRIVEVLEPGPLGGKLRRWEHARGEAAEREVVEAVARFQADASGLGPGPGPGAAQGRSGGIQAAERGTAEQGGSSQQQQQ
ncbi:hypothetical protein HYH03_018261 [Edaphochlamys debaryana]|uniref:Uncharacterized protein n=1 Tax=Edaphochlamys debaryana TaxID=47281 RepID=A0A835XGC0_9CHLO|nr:hypothetical protein HYH03_018261 [Edaphochlamys debaryana]|eukprot:KAG2482820.1 hypothetical protein HYH03_018261 [Edaphochlamys debaryana]